MQGFCNDRCGLLAYCRVFAISMLSPLVRSHMFTKFPASKKVGLQNAICASVCGLAYRESKRVQGEKIWRLDFRARGQERGFIGSNISRDRVAGFNVSVRVDRVCTLWFKVCAEDRLLVRTVQTQLL